MLRKKLVVSGDSYTAGWAPGDAEPIGPLWPEYLGEMLDMDVVNVGLSGKGNEFIYSSVIDKLVSSKDVGLSIAMWNFPGKILGPNVWRHRVADNAVANVRLTLYGRCLTGVAPYLNLSAREAIKNQNMVSMEYDFLKSLRWFNAFQNYCENNKIPYMQCSAFNIISNDMVFLMSNHPIFYKMREDHFYGWPMFQQIGGFNMSDKLNEVDPEMKKFRVSDEDTHPNTDGHKLMAELLYNHYVSIDA